MFNVTHISHEIVNDYKEIKLYNKVNKLMFGLFIDFDLKCRMVGQK